jgi:hypothetical protein
MWGQMQQHREPGGALDERASRRAVEPHDEVAFPAARNATIMGLGASLAEQDLRRHDLLPAALGPRPRNPQPAPGSQTGRRSPFSAPRPWMNRAWEMASCEIRMETSSGNPTRSRSAICSGRHDFAHPSIRAAAVTATTKPNVGTGHHLTVGSGDLGSG